MPDTATKVRDTADRAYRACRSATVRAYQACRSATVRAYQAARPVTEQAYRETRAATVRAYRTGRTATERAVRRARQHWRAAPPQQRQTVVLAAGSAALGFVVAVTAVATTGPWDSGQRTAERDWAAAREHGSGAKHTGEGPQAGGSAPEVLAALGAAAGTEPSSGPGSDNVPPPTGTALADTLEPLLKAKALGDVRTASVVDAASGRELYASKSATPATPASTVKLATAVAALSALGADHRIETRVVRGRAKGDRVVLVGAGDPSLSGGALAELAAETARTLRRSGTEKVSLGYDTSRYSGPERHPIGTNDNIAPVSPLTLDEGRLDGSTEGPAPRSADPAGDAADDFAERLEKRGVEVEGKPKETKAPAKARELGDHRSVPLSGLVERMLTHSDNDIAEALARQTALAKGGPAGFDEAGEAVQRRLESLGLPLKGTHFADGSGLDRADKVTSALLTRLLLRAADPDYPELRPVLTGLPVAGFTGTLGSRYGDERGKAGAGLVRAKTGTLTGVNSLAGTVVDADGRLLLFGFTAAGTKDRDAAQEALDLLASALANCGCRDSPSDD